MSTFVIWIVHGLLRGATHSDAPLALRRWQEKASFCALLPDQAFAFWRSNWLSNPAW